MRITTQLLRLKDAPFLLVTLLGAVGWLIVHLTDRIEKAPTVEYKIYVTTENNQLQKRCRIRNISQSECFQDVKIFFNKLGTSAGTFSHPRILAQAPAGCDIEPRSVSDSVTFKIEQLHPDWEFTLVANQSSWFPSAVVFKTERTSQGVRFLKAGFETFAARNELPLLAALILVFSVMVLRYLYWLNRQVANLKAKK